MTRARTHAEIGQIPRLFWVRQPENDRAGIALVFALVVLMLMAAVVTGGLLVARQQLRSARAVSQGAPALYAAESGLIAALARLDTLTNDPLPPGRRRPLASGTLLTGDRYSTWLTRLDAGTHERLAYYLLESEGRVQGYRGGRRRLALLLKSLPPPNSCCRSALLAGGDVRVSDAAVIDGHDRTPEFWRDVPGLCTAAANADLPGIVVDSLAVVIRDGGGVDGEPPILRDDTSTDFVEAERTFEELEAIAGLSLAAGTTLVTISPSLNAAGICRRGLPNNWGAPAEPDHACFAYLPIIHARGDLRIEASGRGQGILLVEGDLEVAGDFEFYGIAIVRGGIRLTGAGASFLGGVQVQDRGGNGSLLAGGGRLLSSGCARARAGRVPELQLPHPLAQFSWLEILE